MSSSKKMLFDENFFGKQYLNKCTYTITSLWNYCMNTIGNMQNEKDFYDYYNEFEYNHDLVVIVIIIIIVVIIRMNFKQFQFFKRQI